MSTARRGRRDTLTRFGVFLLAVATMFVLGTGCRTPRPSGPDEGSAEARADALGGTGSTQSESEAIPSIETAAVAMRPVDAWAGSRMLRQRVEVEWPSGRERFDAVLQRRPGELALIGLGPMNLVGFRLALVAGAGTGEGAPRIEFENRSGRPLPFSPAHILADVQRVFYPWLEEPWPGEAGMDCPEGCERSGRQEGLAVWERRVAGSLAERRFAIAGRLDAGEVRIRYADWQGEPAMPHRVELENGWFGYRLTIETLEATVLPDR
ncbi:MAG: DUF3261 domain-containing protein [Deltaproteobacteria bacterium]|nr:DUF3261 domain-containing protein [Deltaproteobacteria bacterium]